MITQTSRGKVGRQRERERESCVIVVLCLCLLCVCVRYYQMCRPNAIGDSL
jgi:hypothetical protein